MRSPKSIVKKSQPIVRSAKNKSLRVSTPSLGGGRNAARLVPSAAGVVVCDQCGAVMYDKHWHSKALVAKWLDLKSATSGRCDACRGGKQFVGEVVLEGLKDSIERDEIVALIRNVGKRAMKRDPEERIISVEVVGSRVRVTTTENQLAVSIGKQVHEARKGGELHITWSASDKPVRVVWRKLK
jgi:hypothetical protein